MIFKTNKKHLILLAIDTATFGIVYLFSVFLEMLSKVNIDKQLGSNDIPRYVLNFLLFYSIIFIARYVSKVYHNVWK